MCFFISKIHIIHLFPSIMKGCVNMPFFVCLVIIFVVWLKLKLSKTDKASDLRQKEFWEKEQRANFVRKKDISNLEYITVPMDELPFAETKNEELNYIQSQIKNLSQKKILNLSGYSNTDLKLSYGTANIGVLSEYEQNFNLLLRHLNKWGALLYQEGQYLNAKKVLELALNYHSDIGATYTLLANIYAKEKDFDKIKELIVKADSVNSLTKNNTLNSLNTIYETAFHAQE